MKHFTYQLAHSILINILLLKLVVIILVIINTYRSMVFPVVMYACESWTVKKAEH